jgi:lipoprotein-releasing system permease protein
VRFQLRAGDATFSADTAAELLVGEALARRLALHPGDTVLLITTGSNGQMPLLRRFRIIGIYRSGLVRYEELYVYLPFGTAGRLWGMPESVATGVDLVLPSPEQVRQAPARVEQLLGFPFYALNLYQVHQPLFAWIELQRVPIPLVLGLISLVAVFNVFTFLVLLVVEKTSSFAILQALGMSVKQLQRLLLRQGVRLSFGSAVAGCAVAALVGWIQQHFGIIRLQGALYYVDALPVAFVWWHPVVVVAVAVVLALGASFLPGALLRRLPLTALLHFR